MRHPLHQVSLLYSSPSGFLVGEILHDITYSKSADYLWFVLREIIHPGFTYFWCQHSGNYKPIYTKIMTPLLEFKINVFPYLQPQRCSFKNSHFVSNNYILIIKYLVHSVVPPWSQPCSSSNIVKIILFIQIWRRMHYQLTQVPRLQSITGSRKKTRWNGKGKFRVKPFQRSLWKVTVL